MATGERSSPAAGGRINMNDRRSSGRVPVQLWVDEHAEGGTYFQRATNLSQNGLFLEGTLPHPPGTEIVLDVMLPGDSEPVRVRGSVTAPTKRRPRGMGVRFLDLPEAERARLLNYLPRGACASIGPGVALHLHWRSALRPRLYWSPGRATAETTVTRRKTTGAARRAAAIPPVPAPAATAPAAGARAHRRPAAGPARAGA